MKFLDVFTGEIKVSKGNTIIEAIALGSCIAVIMYDPKKKIGGIAHIMLPGKCPDKNNRFRCAGDAIDDLIRQMLDTGVQIDNIKVCIVGGGNVLKKTDDTICRQNILSVKGILKKKKIIIITEVTGGYVRRSAILNIKAGTILIKEAGKEKVLVQYFK